jgi:hypothetical protein
MRQNPHLWHTAKVSLRAERSNLCLEGVHLHIAEQGQGPLVGLCYILTMPKAL